MHLEILTEGPRKVRPEYLLAGLVPFWRDRGLSVSFRPLGKVDGSADLALVHVNRTFVDEEALAFERARTRVINGAIMDISKRRVSSMLVSERDGYSGPVIVKTNLNFFGAPEERNRMRRRARRVADLLPPSLVRRLSRFGYPVFDYPIFDHQDEVPRWLWRNSRFVIEQFRPERDGELYVTRSWAFFGDQHQVVLKKSASPIVKADNAVAEVVLDAPPPALVRIREQMQIDYGKFDYVEVDGEPILLDVNKTPAMPGRSPKHLALLERFASGISAYLS